MLTPYLLKLKIGGALLALLAIVGAGLYVKSVFAERTTLLSDKARLETELTVEKAKYTVLQEQTEKNATLVKTIIEAVQRVKIKSSVYINQVEATPLPAPLAGGTVLIPGGTVGWVPKVSLPGATGLPLVNTPLAERAAPGSP